MVQALKAMTAKEKPDIFFLMETKNQESVLLRMQRQLHFSNSFMRNPIGIAGGLAVFLE